MSAAQVTDDTKRLALRVYEAILTERDDDACQLIADSEARAVAAVNASLDAAIIRAWGISSERDQLRTERNNLRADLDAIKAIRDEETARADSEAKAVAEWQDFVHLKGEAIDSLLMECNQLRAEVERLTSACDKFSNDEITQGDWKARAERAEAELAKAKAILASIEEDGTEEHNAAVSLRRELATERAKVRLLHSALQNLADEQNGAPLERRREEWQEAMDEACAALAATEETK